MSNSISPRPPQPPPRTINDPLNRDFPDLTNWSRADLEALMTDDIYFDAFVNNTPPALSMQGAIEMKMKDNLGLAQRNESLRPKLEELRQSTTQAFSRATQFKSDWEQIDLAQNNDFKQFSPNIQMNRLRSATSAQQNLLESLVRDFLEGKIPEDVFSIQYGDQARVYHRRNLIMEKWDAGGVDWK